MAPPSSSPEYFLVPASYDFPVIIARPPPAYGYGRSEEYSADRYMHVYFIHRNEVNKIVKFFRTKKKNYENHSSLPVILRVSCVIVFLQSINILLLYTVLMFVVVQTFLRDR